MKAPNREEKKLLSPRDGIRKTFARSCAKWPDAFGVLKRKKDGLRVGPAGADPVGGAERLRGLPPKAGGSERSEAGSQPGRPGGVRSEHYRKPHGGNFVQRVEIVEVKEGRKEGGRKREGYRVGRER